MDGGGGLLATLDNDQSHSSGNFYLSIMLPWWFYEADGFGYLIMQLGQVCRKERGGQSCAGVSNLQQSPNRALH